MLVIKTFFIQIILDKRSQDLLTKFIFEQKYKNIKKRFRKNTVKPSTLVSSESYEVQVVIRVETVF